MATYTKEQEAAIRAQMATANNDWDKLQENKKRVKAAKDKQFKLKLGRDTMAMTFNQGVAKAAALIREGEKAGGAGYENDLLRASYRRVSLLETIK